VINSHIYLLESKRIFNYIRIKFLKQKNHKDFYKTKTQRRIRSKAIKI